MTAAVRTISEKNILEGVLDAVTDFEVDVGPGGLTGAADVGDDLALLHVVADVGDDLGGVAVERLAAVGVLNDDVVAVASVPSACLGDDYVTLRTRHDGGAGRRGEVDSVVSVNALRPHAAGDGAEVIAGLRERADGPDVASRIGNFAPRFGCRGDDCYFSVGNDELVACGERAVYAVVAGYFVGTAAVLLRDGGECVSLLDRVLDSRDRQDGQVLTDLQGGSSGEVVGPQDGVGGNSEHLRNTLERVAGADDVETDSRILGLLDVGDGAGRTFGRNERRVVDYGNLPAAARGHRVDVLGGLHELHGLEVAGTYRYGCLRSGDAVQRGDDITKNARVGAGGDESEEYEKGDQKGR